MGGTSSQLSDHFHDLIGTAEAPAIFMLAMIGHSPHTRDLPTRMQTRCQAKLGGIYIL